MGCEFKIFFKISKSLHNSGWNWEAMNRSTCKWSSASFSRTLLCAACSYLKGGSSGISCLHLHSPDSSPRTSPDPSTYKEWSSALLSPQGMRNLIPWKEWCIQTQTHLCPNSDFATYSHVVLSVFLNLSELQFIILEAGSDIRFIGLLECWTKFWRQCLKPRRYSIRSTYDCFEVWLIRLLGILW